MRLLREARLRAPELEPADWATGEVYALAALQGRVVVLDFFSYADPEGVEALAAMHTLSDHYREAGVVVVGVHVPAYEFEKPIPAARQEMWRLGIPYPVALDATYEVFRAYESRNLPARFVIDADGYVRGWHHGPGGLQDIESAVRALVREKKKDRPLPPPLDPREWPAGVGLQWHATPEIRFGTRLAGFGPPDLEGELVDGQTRDFAEFPEMRAQGAAYLEGKWTVHPDRIVSENDEGGIEIVFEGTSVAAVLSPEDPDAEDLPQVEIALDGAAPDAGAGADLEDHGGRAVVPISRGRLFHLVSAAEFGIHNLSLRVKGRGASVHLLHFGTAPVPEEL
ncbi:MAG: redoxin domain-containing protein [Gemmatimonadetes bacterium]|nr:redoxin domain-containing protein [Gemmatimonadota bacterium]